jgi:hypothetical protein
LHLSRISAYNGINLPQTVTFIQLESRAACDALKTMTAVSEMVPEKLSGESGRTPRDFSSPDEAV